MKNIKAGIHRTAITAAFAIIGIRAYSRLIETVDDYSTGFIYDIVANTLLLIALYMAFKMFGHLVLWAAMGFKTLP